LLSACVIGYDERGVKTANDKIQKRTSRQRPKNSGWQKTMLEGHEAIGKVDPKNIARFKKVRDSLRQSLHRETTSK
jgi:hypothetical protein